MKYLIILIFYITTSHVVSSQTTNKQDSIKNISYFEFDQKKSDAFLDKATKAYNDAQFELAGKYYIKAFQYNSGNDKTLVFNALASYKTANNNDKTILCYNELLENGMDSLDLEKQFIIHQNLAVIFNLQNQPKEVIQSITLAQKIKPVDSEYILLKANSYYSINDKNNFEKQLKKALSIAPNNFHANYNLGVISFEKKDFKQAKYYYQKALTINKNSEAANLNFAVLLLSKETELVDKMNNLGYSKKDKKEYDLLTKKRKEIHKSVVPYLKKVLKANSNNKEAAKTLITIYNGLGKDRKAKKIKDSQKKK
ncbi:tetratricopeptide repeat protein [Olleya sp. Bg11-27]|uniref:tetratricopeptide repeat protein n=1 Tax=Olleya sp. Bg11-27 TaxID=2058135 RepID=UPI000C3008FA|nr:tetratricopeptide repeat protein [Olleya sp. Bg11-27]AUC75678.1 hypothetical protein CW732_08330 [Olleya sp. Bg11-27]